MSSVAIDLDAEHDAEAMAQARKPVDGIGLRDRARLVISLPPKNQGSARIFAPAAGWSDDLKVSGSTSGRMPLFISEIGWIEAVW